MSHRDQSINRSIDQRPINTSKSTRCKILPLRVRFLDVTGIKYKSVDFHGGTISKTNRKDLFPRNTIRNCHTGGGAGGAGGGGAGAAPTSKLKSDFSGLPLRFDALDH